MESAERNEGPDIVEQEGMSPDEAAGGPAEDETTAPDLGGGERDVPDEDEEMPSSTA